MRCVTNIIKRILIDWFSGPATRQAWTLSDVGVSGKLKMVYITGSTFFDLPLNPTSESVHTSFAVSADLENVGDAFGISLLSYKEAEIVHYFISTSGNDGHLWLTIYPDIGEFPH